MKLYKNSLKKNKTQFTEFIQFLKICKMSFTSECNNKTIIKNGYRYGDIFLCIT